MLSINKKLRLALRVFRNGLTASVLIAAALFSLASAAVASDLGLIDAAALKGGAGKWVLLDARPRAEWEAGHIPGALPFSWEDFTRTDARGVRFGSFPPPEMAARLAALGINEKTPLVVYGDADNSWGGEGYDVWLFSWLGHQGPVRLLNGGIQAWRNANFPVVQKGGQRPAKKTRYLVQLKPESSVSTVEVQSARGAYTLVDVRSTLEWLMGSIPGAVHISWDEFYTGKERRPLSAPELRKLLEKHDVDLSKPVVYYCLGGVRSAYTWTVHQLAGLPQARNYKGGWEAWEKRELR